MKTFIAVCIFLGYCNNSFSQAENLKGKWIVVSHQSVEANDSSTIVMDVIADGYLGANLIINKEIYFEYYNVDKELLQFYETKKCLFTIKHKETIPELEKYYKRRFNTSVILLQLPADISELIVFQTGCSARIFQYIYYFSEEYIGLHSQGKFYLLRKSN